MPHHRRVDLRAWRLDVRLLRTRRMFVRERRQFVADNRKNFEGDFLSSKCSPINLGSQLPFHNEIASTSHVRVRGRPAACNPYYAICMTSHQGRSQCARPHGPDSSRVRSPRLWSAPCHRRSRRALDGGRMRNPLKRDTIAGGCREDTTDESMERSHNARGAGRSGCHSRERRSRTNAIVRFGRQRSVEDAFRRQGSEPVARLQVRIGPRGLEGGRRRALEEHAAG